MSGFKTDLLTGLAAWLALPANGLQATYLTTGAYTALQTGIVLGELRPTPDRQIALTAYAVTDDPALSDSVLGVQVISRWGGRDPRPSDDLDDAVFGLLHGRQRLVLSTGVTIVQIMRVSGAPLGWDENQRRSVSSNYYVTVHRASTNRT
jgi:hypothetical protein